MEAVYEPKQPLKCNGRFLALGYRTLWHAFAVDADGVIWICDDWPPCYASDKDLFKTPSNDPKRLMALLLSNLQYDYARKVAAVLQLPDPVPEWLEYVKERQRKLEEEPRNSASAK